MSAPIALRMAFDSGWSHGDPGDGRLRFDSPKIAKAANLVINAKDAQEALLDELVPSWRIGDVLVIERTGADRNRVVAWVIGPITHMGPCYRVPILVRSVHGGFAAHDELALHHHRNVTDVDETSPAPATVQIAPPADTPPALALSPVAPVALTAIATENAAKSIDLTPLAPVAAAPADAATAAELAKLQADNTALHGLLADLLSDQTELYTVEHA